MTRQSSHPGDAGFTLVELIVSTLVLLVISGTVTAALLQMTSAELTLWNRTQMHSGVRSATELLQQEVGQAGRIALPAPVTLTGGVTPGAATVGVSSVAGMFVGEQLTIGAGATEETVTVTALDVGGSQISGSFVWAHADGESVVVRGGFASGVVPTTDANGSTADVLKLFGDVNGDDTMVYVEYTCDTDNGRLYRNSMPYDADAKPALAPDMVLLDNLRENPGGVPCFTYQEQVVGANTYVTDVAITLTVQTQKQDPITKQFELQTKALLNVAPRNIFNVWQLASAGITNRVQATPASIAGLLP
ncbi:MAG: prepilin-type N-terminal cleavage/methylation domain-containing protein [Vicinamibacterales bacterium]